jgi:hypothetical protein
MPLDKPACLATWAFSHQIIHQIGGPDDTNRNTTQRILLLLESLAIGDDDAHNRVLTATLQRYLEGDVSFVNGLGGNTVPRFLLNDIVRFWRTVAVDFAAKQRDRSGTGWGLRNAKLRMSRKLIFAAGLLICFDCHLNRPPALDDAQLPSAERLMIWLEFLKERVLETPLEIVSRFLYGQNSPSARALLDSYEAFLALLENEELRKHLDNLKIEQARGDSVFQEVRQMGHSFQDALTRILFDESKEVRDLVRKYGIF